MYIYIYRVPSCLFVVPIWFYITGQKIYVFINWQKIWVNINWQKSQFIHTSTGIEDSRQYTHAKNVGLVKKSGSTSTGEKIPVDTNINW